MPDFNFGCFKVEAETLTGIFGKNQLVEMLQGHGINKSGDGHGIWGAS
jgi:hypothetical protein